MNKFSLLLVLFLLISCSDTPRIYTEYTERGWVRGIHEISFFEEGIGYMVTFERDYPKGEIISINVSGPYPPLWVGEHVEIKFNKVSDYRNKIQSTKLLEEKPR